MTASSRALRADARRNRDRLLEVAVSAFAEEGSDVTLEGVAREAGVGIGTLYRHFPTREALVEAVHGAELTRLCDAVEDLLAYEDPEAALREWMLMFVDFMATKHSMAGVLRVVVSAGGDPYGNSRARALEAVAALLGAAARAGGIRPPEDPLDVLVVLNGISLAAFDQPQVERLVDMVIDGLRHRACCPQGARATGRGVSRAGPSA